MGFRDSKYMYDVPGLPYYENGKEAYCDKCGASCQYSGKDISEAKDLALKLGWKLIRAKKLSDPMILVCVSCALR